MKSKQGEQKINQTAVPIDKVKELGAHYHKYYQLECSIFKSKIEN